jgi:hypothetical protein
MNQVANSASLITRRRLRQAPKAAKGFMCIERDRLIGTEGLYILLNEGKRTRLYLCGSA